MRPCSVADLDERAKKAMTEEEIKMRLTTSDEQRACVKAELIEKSIQAPGQIMLQEVKDEPTQRRVSLTEEQRTIRVRALFNERPSWTVEEIANTLNHPKEPINVLMKKIGKLDPITKSYTLKDSF